MPTPSARSATRPSWRGARRCARRAPPRACRAHASIGIGRGQNRRRCKHCGRSGGHRALETCKLLEGRARHGHIWRPYRIDGRTEYSSDKVAR
eukprot:1179543-Prorocentrum_minimum.AAC.1